MIDYKALKGDPTDNIPGVPGVGEKTAAKLIREFGDLDSLLARIDEVTPEKLRDKLPSIASRSSWAASCRRSCATCRSSSTSRLRGSPTTTATPSSGCSANTSSGH